MKRKHEHVLSLGLSISIVLSLYLSSFPEQSAEASHQQGESENRASSGTRVTLKGKIRSTEEIGKDAKKREVFDLVTEDKRMLRLSFTGNAEMSQVKPGALDKKAAYVIQGVELNGVLTVDDITKFTDTPKVPRTEYTLFEKTDAADKGKALNGLAFGRHLYRLEEEYFLIYECNKPEETAIDLDGCTLIKKINADKIKPALVKDIEAIFKSQGVSNPYVELTNQKTTLQELEASLDTEEENLHRLLSGRERQIREYKIFVGNLKQTKRELGTESTTLDDDDLNKTITRLQEAREYLENLVSDKNTEIQDQEAKIEKIEKELAKLQSRVDELTQEHNKYTDKVEIKIKRVFNGAAQIHIRMKEQYHHFFEALKNTKNNLQ